MDKNAVDKTFQNVGNVSKIAIEKIIPNVGAGAAAGSAAAAAIKASGHLPPLQRAALVGGTTLITAASAKFGLDIGSAISKNSNLEGLIKNSEHANPAPNSIPSPDRDSFINSALESGDITSPLQDLLLYSCIVDIFILFIVISLIIIIFNRNILCRSCN